MEKKYILTDETIQFNGKTLYRIKAIKNFGNVKDGDLGGWIEKEENLSQEGNCWVYDEAVVCDNAKICNNAKIMCNAIIMNNAVVKDNAQVCDYVIIRNNGIIGGNTILTEDVEVYSDAIVTSDIQFEGSLLIYSENGKLYCTTLN